MEFGHGTSVKLSQHMMHASAVHSLHNLQARPIRAGRKETYRPRYYRHSGSQHSALVHLYRTLSARYRTVPISWTQS
jgi:hypothetical protein